MKEEASMHKERFASEKINKAFQSLKYILEYKLSPLEDSYE